MFSLAKKITARHYYFVYSCVSHCFCFFIVAEVDYYSHCCNLSKLWVEVIHDSNPAVLLLRIVCKTPKYAFLPLSQNVYHRPNVQSFTSVYCKKSCFLFSVISMAPKISLEPDSNQWPKDSCNVPLQSSALPTELSRDDEACFVLFYYIYFNISKHGSLFQF